MSASNSLSLVLWPDELAICRLDARAGWPEWAENGRFLAITRTPTELSVVCPQHLVPATVSHEPGWRMFAVVGPLPFTLVGVLASLVQPLAEAGVSVFAVSTFDTDYLLVKAAQLETAVVTLRHAGHTITTT
ncbi:MAG: ACT domain-containing protein [Chloroflexi bacterium]|nr:MAG: ACT domain-containing protein [Chloroflexota bacterium]